MRRYVLFPLFLVLLGLTLTACGGGSGSASSNGGGSSQAQVFVTGEDAPLPSVVSFYVTINSIILKNSTSQVTVLSTPTTVDFGRLMGLRSLLGFNTVAAGTYTSATFSFAKPVIYYVDLSTNPPTVKSVNGSLTNSTVTVAFPNSGPLKVGSNGLAGLHMDFDLRKWLAVDSNGQITGSVNPHVDIMAVSASEEFGEITDFTGTVVSANSGANSFTMQGPYGFQEVIDVDSSTQYNGSNSLANVQDAVVSVEGKVQADGSILAAYVEVITTHRAFISGRILAINGSQVTLFVGEELPDMSPGIKVDKVYTVDLSAVVQYDVCFFNNWFSQQVFNASTLVVGQRIFVGGTYQNSVFAPSMVSLRRQGVLGTLAASSVNITNGNLGSFQMQNDLLMSYSAGGPFVVNTGNATIFENINGLAGLQGAGTVNVVARGLVFKDLNTGKPVVWAQRVTVLPE